MIDKKKELQNCNGIKVILMLCIVLYHSMALYMRGGGWSPYTPVTTSPILGYVAEWMNNFHVYAFTLISGYIFYAQKIECGKYNQYFPFLINKAKRLIVPYIFIVLIWVMPTYIYFYGSEGVVTKYLLGYNPSQLWFLLMLFWIFVIFWWLSDVINKHPVLGAIIVLILYLIAASCSSIPDIFCFKTGLQYMIFFYIGFVLRKYGTKILMRIPSLMYIALDLILFFVFEWCSSCEGTFFYIGSIGLRLLLHIFGSVMAFVVLQRVVTKLGSQNRLINFFYKHSMAIYLVHQQLIYFTIMWFNGRVAPIMQVTINFAFALSVSTLFAWIMSKTKATRFLMGSG